MLVLALLPAAIRTGSGGTETARARGAPTGFGAAAAAEPAPVAGTSATAASRPATRSARPHGPRVEPVGGAPGIRCSWG
jgi:hypothetical protein